MDRGRAAAHQYKPGGKYMLSSWSRRVLLATSAVAALAVSGAASASEVRFSIQPQQLDEALRAFGLQSGTPISFRGVVLGQARSAGAIGELEPEVALGRILRGTPFRAVKVRDGFVVVDGNEARPRTIRVASLMAQSAPVLAQAAEPASAPRAELEEVIVTARRVDENLQRVPVSVTAITDETLVKGAVNDQFSMLSQVPGLAHYTKSFASAASAAKMRGVQGIAYYFNGIPFSTFQWVYFSPFFDIQNVQVLKGPQGTLFGQASNAGAILAIPKKPGENFGGYIQAKVGTDKLLSVEGALDLPLVPDKVLLRVSAIDYFRDGYVKDTVTGTVFGEEDYNIVRGVLVVRPTEALENETLVQMERVKNLGEARTLNAFNMQPTFNMAPGAALNGMTVDQYRAARDLILAQQIALGPYKMQGWSTGCPASAVSPATNSTVPGPNVNSVIPQACPPFLGGRAQNYAVTNTTTLDLTEEFTLKNIFGYTWGREKRPTNENDYTRLIIQDSNPRALIYQKYAPTLSNELQLIGDVGNLDFVAGVFAFKSKLNQKTPVYAQFINNLNTTATRTDTDNRSWAVYAQGNYDLSAMLPGLSATAGVRRTEDHLVRTNYVLNPTTLAVTSQTGGKGNLGGEGKWNALTYTVGLQYQVTDDAMLYITNAKGYSTGGLQNIPGFDIFNPDSLNNIEVGVKATSHIGDWSVRTNAAAYYGFFDNVKVTQSLVFTIPGTTSQSVTNAATRNAAESRVKGFELELDATNGRFDISGFVAYGEAHFLKYPSINPTTRAPIDRKDDPVSNLPKWKVGISPTYHLPVESMGMGDVSIFAQYNFVDTYWTNYSKPIVPLTAGDPNTGAVCKEKRTAANGYGPLSADGKTQWVNCSPPWHNVNVGVTWSDVMGREGLTASMVVTNATFYKGNRGVGSIYDGAGFNALDPTLPRNVNLSLRYDF